MHAAAEAGFCWIDYFEKNGPAGQIPAGLCVVERWFLRLRSGLAMVDVLM
jgi:hypothetical protein